MLYLLLRAENIHQVRDMRLCLDFTLIRHSNPHLESLPETTYTSQRRRCAEPLLIHPPLHTLRRPSTDRHHNIWKGMQALCKNKEGDCGVTSAATG